MDPSALLVLTRRIRWRNVARVGAVAALGLLVLAWPRLSSPPVAVPAAGAVPVIRGPVGRVVLAPGPGAHAAAPARTAARPPARSAAVRAQRRRAERRPARRRPRPERRPAKRPSAPGTPSISLDPDRGKWTASRVGVPVRTPATTPTPAATPTPASTPTPATTPTTPPRPAAAPVPSRHPAREFGPAGGDFGR